MEILVDGHKYAVDHENNVGGTETVIVSSADTGADMVVICAFIEHNCECISIKYGTDEGPSDCSYNYFEYTGDNAVTDLATWMVATSY